MRAILRSWSGSMSEENYYDHIQKPTLMSDFDDISSNHELFTFSVLCFVNIINYMDRYCIAGVLVHIQEFYLIGDDLAGLLQSGFFVSYMLTSPMFGYLGDRYSRRLLNIFSISLWSLMTLCGSFAYNYPLLFLCRCGVGIGEAGFSTIAPTVISDIYFKVARSRALAIFYIAIPLGSGLGYLVSAKITDITGNWRWGLRATPILGVLSAMLMCCGADPIRGEKEAAAAGGSATAVTSYRTDLNYLLRNSSFVLSTAAFTCVSFITGALSWWGPKTLYYGFKLIPGNTEISLDNVVFIFGAVTVLTGLLGVSLGYVCSKKLRPHFPFVDPIICGVGLFLSTPLFVAAMFTCTRQEVLTFVLVFFGLIMLNMNWALVSDIMLYVLVPTRRASGSALQMLFSHAFGDCSSPYIVGFLSEIFKQHIKFDSKKEDSDSQIFYALRLSLLIIMIVEALGGVFFLCTSYFIVRDKEESERLGVIKPNANTNH